MNPDYNIKDYEDKHLPGVFRLFKDVFGKDMDQKHFQWKNINNPQGKSIIKLALKEDEVIGLSSIWMFSMEFMGKKIIAGQSVDAMVHREHRKKGIFENLAMAALDDMKNAGFQLRFNFPNEAAYKASIGRINIKKVCDIPQYIKILKGKEASSMFTTNKLIKSCGGLVLDLYKNIKNVCMKKTSGYSIVEIKRFDYKFDELWNNIKNDYPIAVERSSKYLNWRYVDSPEEYKIYGAYKNNELVGYMVTAIESKTGKGGENLLLGHIADFICYKEHKAGAYELIREAEKKLKEAGVCAISCWMIKEWFYSQILSRAGFLQLRSPSVLAALPVGELAKAAGDALYDHRNWYVTIGDSDYI
ncbi:GNAT family N-acetyltransferase [Lutispora thermophila]|uniref:Acetyltransferase (GNAT) domain-containing protein n=1 Tax=Lutispora thermophila DSM 19022 TaxID=1122184 RepID=A0A1M6FKN8_9FIRM|nr:GNAT family N-acetyltransferase [Lutispora thermophila]SHI98235.1 Acetyltransferase (GNAT) domain-containing protein [Lutispora thermophila DSM 19022]